jgi:hypothetical protein
MIDQFRDSLEEYTQKTQANRLQRAEQALAPNVGLPGIGIEELRGAEESGISLSVVRASLVDLYTQTGQVDQALALIEETTPSDPSLSTGPGTAAYRQGLVYFLLAYYHEAASYWEKSAIPPLRYAQSSQSLSATWNLLQGLPIQGEQALLQISGTPNEPGLLASQAEWEAELGLCQLEAGVIHDTKDAFGNESLGAATHLKKALELRPDIPTRALLVYYLEQMGESVPAAPTEEPAPEQAEGTPATEPKPEPAPAPATPESKRTAEENNAAAPKPNKP